MALNLNSLIITSSRESIFNRFWWNKTLKNLQNLIQNYIDANSGGIKKAVLELSASDIQNLRSTPLEVIPAPGAGKYINLIGGQVFAYTGSNSPGNARVNIIYNTSAALDVPHPTLTSRNGAFAPSFLYGANPKGYLNFAAGDFAGMQTIAENVGIVVNLSSNPTAGQDSTGKIILFYTIENI